MDTVVKHLHVCTSTAGGVDQDTSGRQLEQAKQNSHRDQNASERGLKRSLTGAGGTRKLALRETHGQSKRLACKAAGGSCHRVAGFPVSLPSGRHASCDPLVS